MGAPPRAKCILPRDRSEGPQSIQGLIQASIDFGTGQTVKRNKESRNPIYVAFAVVLLGQCLIFSNWILLVYLGAAVWLFHRQVLREEDYLKQHYGQEYLKYCQKVRRYL